MITISRLLWLPLLTGSLAAQTETIVTLQINSAYEQKISFSFDLKEGGEVKPQYAFADRAVVAPGDTVVTFEDSSVNQSGYSIRVDADGDGDLLEEPKRALVQDSPITVGIRRHWASGIRELPYRLAYQVRTDKTNRVRESLIWSPHYRAEGTFRFKNCVVLLAVLDMDGNGVFDATDSRRGTTIGLDRNGDGKIWGRDEWLRADQIIEYCGESFSIADLSPDGSFVKFVTTESRVPKLGGHVLPFTLETVAGETVTSEDLEGETYLLDFWASWCSPCVKKFPRLQEIDKECDGRMKVIAVNVDTEENAARAEKIIQQYNLTWDHVMNKMGDSDPLWRMFGSMEGIRMTIPLYVLVDSQGQIQYANNGGADLKELALEVKSVLGE